MAEIEIKWSPLVPVVARDSASTLDVVMRIAATAPPATGPRAPLNLALVIDRSGSMQGPKLEQAKEAACRALGLMGPDDRVSVVVFDDEVDTLVPSTPVVDRAAIADRIRGVQAGGSTALCAGWEAGRDQVRAHLDPRRLNRVVLLSDGQANVGVTNLDEIATRVSGAEQAGVSTSALGLGDHYNEALMEAMALSGDGNFWDVDGAGELQPLMAAELQGLLALVGRKVSLGLTSDVGVEVLDIYNDFARLPNGRWKLPNLMAGKEVVVALRLHVPAISDEADLVRARVALDDPQSGRRVVHHAALRLQVVATAMLPEFPPDPAVREVVTLLEVTRLRQIAVAALKEGNREAARETLIAIARRLDALPASIEVKAELARVAELQGYLEEGRYERFSKKSSSYNFDRRRSK